jgi:hypothetical protein
MRTLKASQGGEGPYIILRDYGSEGWCVWQRYGSVEEAIEDVMAGCFSEPIALVKEVSLSIKEINK